MWLGGVRGNEEFATLRTLGDSRCISMCSYVPMFLSRMGGTSCGKDSENNGCRKYQPVY